MSVKGSWRRPCQTSREEQELREKYADGRISFARFEKEYKRLTKEGKIIRSGRVIRDE